MNAVDLSRGEIAWSVPLGGIRELEEQSITGTGTPSLGGTIATAGGLVFVAETGDHRFRAFDAVSGAELWRSDREAGGHATPMTYLGRDGRQYVVIAAGGGGYFSSDLWSDAVVAFALPNAADATSADETGGLDQ